MIDLMQVTHLILACLYIPPMVAICLFGAHRLKVLLSLLATPKESQPIDPQWWASKRPADLPRVTVQLPMYNEANVAQRAINAACQLDYPAQRLQIQVLDDSTQQDAQQIAAAANHFAAKGHPVHYRHRNHRQGYKAGALADGLHDATGELVAIFDADFVPKPDFLHQMLPEFDDPKVGMVQARWSHINAEMNWLTRAQAILLDGHFLLEQRFRAMTGRWFNFNGTAGIWRTTCIDDAGGWQQDTLTEDTDLSYRAQLKGWKFVYRPDVSAPAELPPTVKAFCAQQHRWNKGLTQTAIKLVGQIIKSPAPIRCKTEAILHLTSPVLYIAIAFLAVIAIPATVTLATLSEIPQWLALTLGAGSLTLGMGAAGLFYLVTQFKNQQRGLRALLNLPILLGLGIGICLIVTRGVFEAMVGYDTPFVRTPKFNSQHPLTSVKTRTLSTQGISEILLGTLLMACFVVTCIYPGTLVGSPFIFLFSVSFSAIGFSLIRETFLQNRNSSHSLCPQVATEERTLLADNAKESNLEIQHQSDIECHTTTSHTEPFLQR